MGVRVIRVGTLFERMSYDKDVIVVRAGKPVEFVFENSDLMPHNLVDRPSRARWKSSACWPRRRPNSPARPSGITCRSRRKVLLASTLLQPRASEKLSFTAPNEPGVYPYVCTYPGPLAADVRCAVRRRRPRRLPGESRELPGRASAGDQGRAAEDRRPRTEWKLDDLAAAVGDLKDGRSYGNGKQIFTVANCIACHKLDGAGNAIGPDLTKLDAKFQSLDVLKELLEPSARINEKFQSYLFELDSGKVVTGLVLDETPERVRVIENPLAKAEALELKPGEIVSRQKSSSSIMPKGLLDKLSREEILDLIAYVVARGNPDLPLFHGGHDHGEKEHGSKAHGDH